MRALLDNPILSWDLRQLRGDVRALAGAAVFGLGFYGVLSAVFAVWVLSGTRAMPLRELLTSLHYFCWSVVLLILLLWAPTRLAQQLARDRERGQHDALRLTGLGGLDLAVSSLVSALTLPLLLVAVASPAAVATALVSENGAWNGLRAHLVLLLLAPVYSLAGGLAGLAGTKVRHAGSAAVVVCMGGLIVSGIGWNAAQDLRPVSLFGPWSAGLAETARAQPYEVFLCGALVPAEVLHLPLVIALASGLLLGLARRLAGEHALLVGRTGAIVLAAAIVAVAGLTFAPEVISSAWAPGRPAPIPDVASHMWRLVVIGAALLLVAAESTARWREVVRGLTRRAPDALPLPAERLSVGRFLAGPQLLLAWLVLAALALAGPGSSAVTGGSVALGALVLLSTWAAAALVVQAVVLLAHDRRLALVGALVGLTVVWCAPWVGSVALLEAGGSPLVVELPRALNPVYGAYLAAYGPTLQRSSLGVDPLGLAWACVGFQTLLAAGAGLMVRRALDRAAERAASLVALPADVYRPAGSLGGRCSRGHLYDTAWASCPHCASPAES